MRSISFMMVFILTTLSISTSYAQTKMISTMETLDGISLDLERKEIVKFMQSKFVQSHMVKMGVDPQEAINRVAALSESEVKTLSKEIQKAPAGGDFGVGSIIGAAVFIFIVLLITDILGFTKIFPFTRSIR